MITLRIPKWTLTSKANFIWTTMEWRIEKIKSIGSVIKYDMSYDMNIFFLYRIKKMRIVLNIPKACKPLILILIFGILEWWVSFLVIHHNITQIKLYKYASWKNAHIKHKSIIFDHPGDVFPGLCITISHSRGKIYVQIYAQLHRNNIFTTQNKWRTFMKSCNLIIVLKNINNYKTVS